MKKIQAALQPLAKKLRRDLSKGRFLHDCATKLSRDDMLNLALEVGLRTADTVCENPMAAYHARLGAVVARRDYG